LLALQNIVIPPHSPIILGSASWNSALIAHSGACMCRWCAEIWSTLLGVLTMLD